VKTLTKEEFRHRVLRAQRKRKHLTNKKAFLSSLYQSDNKNRGLLSGVNITSAL